MSHTKLRKALQLKGVALAAVLVVAGAGVTAQTLPDMGVTGGDPWSVENFYENHTAKRESVGLSKFRNTFQSEMSKNLNDGWRFRGILRGTYDGVYDLNDKEYGKNAGGPVMVGDQAGALLGGSGYAQYGEGVGYSFINSTFGASTVNNNFVNTYTNNPNQGLQILGSGWNKSNSTGGVGLAVPVRPCDYDSRGCKDFGGYGDSTIV